MKKAEIIAKYGEEEYKRRLAQARERTKKYSEENPEKIKANNQEANRKGGKHYDQKLEYNHTGLQGQRNKIRTKHGNNYRPFKKIIAPDSQIHHEWVPDTSKYRGIALVEAEQHMHGIVDVIEILEG